MSFTLNSLVFKLFLPIIVGVAIIGTLDTIKTESLDPNVDSAQGAINAMDRTAILADSDSENSDRFDEDRARNEFKQLVLYNMYTAQHCGIFSQIEELEAQTGEPEDISQADGNMIIFPHSKTPFKVLKEESEDGEVSLTCVGAGPVAQVDVSDMRGAIKSEETKQQTYDMEGRFGRINFETENTFVIEEPFIGATNFGFQENWGEGNYPDVWNARRNIMILPDGLTVQESCDDLGWDEWAKNQVSFYGGTGGFWNKDDINTYGKGVRGIYAFRLMMPSSAPKIKEGAMIENGGTVSFCGSSGNSPMHKFIKGSDTQSSLKYVICEGAQGFFQSNAKEMRDGGESAELVSGSVNVDYDHQIIFPYMILTQKAQDCITNNDEIRKVSMNQVISPRLDFDGEGDRERCNFKDDVKDGSESREWEGLTVKCGLLSGQTVRQPSNDVGGIEYHNTVWYAENSQECNGDREYDLTDTAQKKKISRNFYRDGYIFMGGISEDKSREIKFNLKKFDSIDRIIIDVNTNDKADVEYKLNTRDDSTYKAKTNYDIDIIPPDHTNGYIMKVEKNGDESNLGEFEPQFQSADNYEVVFDAEDNEIRMGDMGTVNVAVEEEPETLAITAGHSYFGGKVNDDVSLNLESVKVVGDLRACS